ncbi:MAG TPA: ABC transporter permease [Candidatus Sulfotelmatobacter sp.]|nr:ABC transporter permease [Candidatus Sulfotelmatobacter sp.]
MRALRAQLAMEFRLVTRRGENLLVTLGIPLLLLVFLAKVDLIPAASGALGLEQLVPGILCLALISTGLVSLGIATAFERGNGTLKRLASSPLPRWALLTAKTGAVVATVVVQVVVLGAVGVVLGWTPSGGPVPALVAAAPWLVLGTVCSAAGGLLLAGLLRPEATLAVANALYLVILLLGGVIIPLAQLPGAFATIAGALPPALMADLVRGALVPGDTVQPVEVLALAAWTVILGAATMATFRSADTGA